LALKQKKYSYGKQLIEKDDIQAVISVLKSDWLTQGPGISGFEKALCDKFGVVYASAVSNGTAALHLTGLALGWKPGDIVITSPLTFLASANCIVYSGATPDFADIDERYFTIDVKKLEEKLNFYKSKRKKVKAVVAVDYAGHPCDWESLKFLSGKYNFQLVNDYCHAAGAEYKNDLKYAVKYADAACMSFHPVKHITTGEGGAVLTNNKELDSRIKVLRTHGIVKNNPEFKMRNSKLKDAPWYYEMQMLGFNYRITDFQCALGVSQLKKLDRFLIARRKTAGYYDKIFSETENVITPGVASFAKHAYHLYPLQIKFDRLKITKQELFRKLSASGINCQVHYIPVHLQPYYAGKYGFKKGDFPAAEKFYEQEISIPLYPSLNKKDVTFISIEILKLLK
jgi:UDP-4-amino-4,6-dideoxy-N-acetyl-beta-L-altrosamine transaminase